MAAPQTQAGSAPCQPDPSSSGAFSKPGTTAAEPGVGSPSQPCAGDIAAFQPHTGAGRPERRLRGVRSTLTDRRLPGPLLRPGTAIVPRRFGSGTTRI
jgi:hypothetical protein